MNASVSLLSIILVGILYFEDNEETIRTSISILIPVVALYLRGDTLITP